MGEHIEGAIDRADFGGFDNSRQPGRMQSTHLQDVVERRARELSPDRGPAGPRGSYKDRDLDREPYLPRVPRNYDRGPLPPEDYRETQGTLIVVMLIRGTLTRVLPEISTRGLVHTPGYMINWTTNPALAMWRTRMFQWM